MTERRFAQGRGAGSGKVERGERGLGLNPSEGCGGRKWDNRERRGWDFGHTISKCFHLR